MMFKTFENLILPSSPSFQHNNRTASLPPPTSLSPLYISLSFFSPPPSSSSSTSDRPYSPSSTSRHRIEPMVSLALIPHLSLSLSLPFFHLLPPPLCLFFLSFPSSNFKQSLLFFFDKREKTK
uniref:Uncharacterized protein n=1 Tax=Nelumbo nucifera TaxID=4432 RepID=A0A822YE51_NELNU|nr:TPA_asm: hypothetical protein HUJ06_011305 [Nelumbo nucifera]